VITGVAEELRKDNPDKDDIIEPVENFGRDRFEDSAMVIIGRLKTRPIRQWRVGRELNLRIKKRSDREGIEIPFPRRTVYFGNLSKNLIESYSNRKEEQDGRKGS
jgi:small conductance mechanosensitive channel